MAKVALTTTDNPYNPFTHWDEWFAFDELKGYCSCSLLARFAKTSIELNNFEIEERIDKAIDRIIELNINEKYKKIYKDN